MKNKFTEYLLQQGWAEEEPMRYTKKGTDYLIFFDTSSQIEVYNNNKWVKNAYLRELEDMIRLLNTL